MQISKTQAKTILTPSKLPDTDFVINPYTGCAFGCTYCYASFMARYIGRDISDWGKFVNIKENAAEVLQRDLQKLKNKGKGMRIFFSSVTDPYQGLEAKYQLTRKCLQVLLDYGFEGSIGILTKSHMVLRDIDLFKQFKDIEVGLTITTTDDKISRYFEKGAPNASQRLQALKELNAAGIKTYCFVGPLLPHYVAQPDKLDELFKEIAETGTRELYIEHINLSRYILERLRKEMQDMDPEVLEKFYFAARGSKGAGGMEYIEELNDVLYGLVKKYGFKLRLGKVIVH